MCKPLVTCADPAVVLPVCVVLRYSAGAHANILWSAGVRDRSEVTEVMDRLQAAGMPTMDISDMDAARVRREPGVTECMANTPGDACAYLCATCCCLLRFAVHC